MITAALVYFLLMTANYSLRPVRDALALTGGSDDLPWLFTGTFVAVLALVPVYGYAASRFGRSRLVPIVYRSCALVLVGFFALLEAAPSWFPEVWAAAGFFIWISAFNLFATSLLWSALADRFAEADARRVFGLVALGGSLGALWGPGIAALTAQYLSPTAMLLFAAALLEVGIRYGRSLWHAEGELDAVPPLGGSPFAGLAEVLRSPHLQALCLYLLLMSGLQTIAYFVQGHVVEAAFSNLADRTTALATLDIAANALNLIGQALLTGRLLSRFGLSFALVALPIASAVGLGLVAVWPVFWAVALLQVGQRSTKFILAKPAREVLFTSVSRSERYKAKSFIDTVVYRGGDALAGWGFTGLLALGLGLSGIAGLAVPLALGWGAFGLALGRRHARGVDVAADPR